MIEITDAKKDKLHELSLEHFNKVKANCPYVDIEEEEYNKIIVKYAEYAAFVASAEKRATKDRDGYIYRFLSGFIGEYGFSKYLGVSHKFKGSYPGGSFTNDAVDLGYLGLNMGIKSSQVGGIVKVGFKERFAQIICQYKWLSEPILTSDFEVKERKYIRVYFMGILKPEYIPMYCNRDYLDDKAVLDKGSKGGFFEFDKLVKFSKENIAKYKSKVQVDNFLTNGMSELAVNIVKNSCILLEKEVGWELVAQPFPPLENDAFKFHKANKEFKYMLPKDQEAFLEILSKRVIIGYGVAGYLHTLQDRYTGDKEFNLRYIDLDDIIRMYNLEDSAMVSAQWVNKLYAWIDYVSKFVDVPRERGEDYNTWHHRLCIAYMETMYKKLKDKKVA